MEAKDHQYYLLDLDSLAKSLKLSSIDVIKTSNMDIESHWYRSIGPADFYYWKAKGRVVKHQITLFDQVIEWNEFDGVKTGYFSEERDGDHSQVIQFDSHVNSHVLDQALVFLGKVDSIDKSLINQFIEHYSFYNRWSGTDWAGSLSSFFKKLFKK
jgi:hypothetical protein